jgi:hypothetical protein
MIFGASMPKAHSPSFFEISLLDFHSILPGRGAAGRPQYGEFGTKTFNLQFSRPIRNFDSLVLGDRHRLNECPRPRQTFG